ncbi:MAG: phosphoribosylamine--glycine ligase [Nitrospirales bacterium]|nr:phosphoribosylamine--glycine ligase [Nitrospira sp.]MDR4501874.1 phosphoribosylamine--glycine ligase [Nitrospirales bacterium]
MNILVIGNGGREHALVWKLSQSPRVSKLYCAPGNAGTAQLAENVSINVDDLSGLMAFAREKRIDLTVVGPELPLSLGVADEFRKAKLRIFGPTRNAACIESSKSFAKDLLLRCHVPTAMAKTFDQLDQAIDYIHRHPVPVVVKADGLAQGKGVVVAETQDEAKEAVTNMLQHGQFGEASSRVMIEEFIEGEELTLMAFADGRTVVPMPAAQDHKRIGDQDTGLNTGGMGAYAPAPIATDSLRQRIVRDVLYPVVEGLSRVGSPYYGVLYAGLMIKNGEPYVLEFNARFGDPETQVVLPLLKTDLVDVLEAVVEHRLDQVNVDWYGESAVCVVLTSDGYPGSYKTGLPISGLSGCHGAEDVVVFHAGTTFQDDQVVTSGGRVLGVTARSSNLRSARDRAYHALESIDYQGKYYRRDIATRALPDS